MAKRLEKLEALTQAEEMTRFLLAIEDDHAPGLYHLDDGRTLTEPKLEALPGKGPGCHGLIIENPHHRGHREP